MNKNSKLRDWAVRLLAVAILFCARTSLDGADFALRTGLNAYFRTTANSASLTPSRSITMEAWIKPTGPGVIFNEVDSLNIANWDVSLAEVNAQGDVIIGMPGIAGAVSIGRLLFGEWAHVAFRYNATSGVLDGFLNGQQSAGFLVGNRTFPPSNAFMCFGRAAQTKLATGAWLPAEFDEVRMWSLARTDEQITASWKLRIPTTAAGLVQNFHLDDGSGTNVTPITDSSGRQNGVNVNATWVPSTLELIQPPGISSVSAVKVSDDVIQLAASIDPNGSITTYYFEYGETNVLGVFTATNSLPAQDTEVSVTATLTNLPVGAYAFRAIATNAGGRVTSAIGNFAITNVAGSAATFSSASGYVRGHLATRTFFTNAALTAEFWFEVQPGVLLNEVDAFDVSRWDYALLEVRTDGTLVAGAPGIAAFDVANLPLGEWRHVALRYDPQTANLDVFIDGVKTASRVGTRLLPWDAGRDVYFVLGRGGPTNLGIGAFYHGAIDEVRIWRTAIADATIAANRNLILNGRDTNLFANWSFESVAGSFSPDKSPHNNPAHFVNGVVLGPSQAPLILDPRASALTGNVQDTLTTGAIINGTIISPGTNNVAYFIWGVGELTNTTTAVPFGAGTNAVQATLSGLQTGVTYSFALVASNAFGLVQGPTVSFVKLGWAGYALSLNSGSYIRTINDQRPFFPDETITVELWLKPKKQGVVLAETDRVSPTLLDSSIIEILGSGNVVAGFPGVPTIVIGKIEFDTWNNIILRYDRATQTMAGFVNGVKSASSSGDRVAGWEIGRSVTYTFGKTARDPIGTGESLAAEWDEIRLWSVARTDADILATFDKKLFGTETGMVAYYRMDEQSSSLVDASRHNNGGAVLGGFTSVVSGADIDVAFTPVRPSASNVIAQFVGIPGREMQIEATTDFITWTPGQTVIVDPLGIATFTLPQASSYQFFRAKQL